MMGISFSVKFFISEIFVALSYVPIVAVLSVVPLIGGLIIGTGIALANVYKIKILKKISQIYVIIIRAVPILLQMLLAYYVVLGIYKLFGWNTAELNKFVIVIVVFIIDAGCYLGEGIRGALSSVETSQYEASHSIGMTRLQALRYVIIPQCLPVAVPIIGQGFISIIKGSAAAYLMGIIEMIQGTSMKTAGNYRYLEAYCAVAIVYWAMTVIIEQVTRILQKRTGRFIKV